MSNSLKKRGQRFLRKFSRASIRASEEGKEHIKENLINRIPHAENIRLLILEWTLLVFALIMLAITQAFWFGESYAEHSFTSGGTYIEATIGKVNSMNPLFATTSSEKVLSRLMFATISTVDYSGHLNYGLASKISASDNGRIWTVKLRDNLKWSDGQPITEDDIIFTIELIKNPAVSSIYNANFKNVKVDKTENNEIVFTLPTAYADFLSALEVPVVPKHILENTDPKTLIENNFSNSPTTSGAFSFNASQTSTSPDEQVVYLSANPNYYKGKPLLSSFAVHTYADKTGVINAVNAGSVTATAELTAADKDQVKNKTFQEKNSSLHSGAFLFFNTTKDAVKDVRVRQAIRQGIDIAQIRNAAPDTIALDYPILDSQIKTEKPAEIPSFNFEEAKAKIEELLSPESRELNIVTVNRGFLPSVTNIIASELEKLGFKININISEENQDFITNIIAKRNYDILIYETELGADPDLLPYYHSSQATAAGLNLSNYRNVLVDALLMSARNTTNQELRTKKYESFQNYWLNDVPAIGLYQSNLTYYFNKNVRTFSNDIKLVTAIDRFTDINSFAVEKSTKNKTP